MPEDKLVEIYNNHFKSVDELHTEEVALDLTIRHIVAKKGHTSPNYDDAFGTIAANEKLKLNGINERLSADIKSGLDYSDLMDGTGTDDNTLAELRNLVVDDIYARILAKELSSRGKIEGFGKKTAGFLHQKAAECGLDFNKVISKLHDNLAQRCDVRDFNTSNVGWIVIAYFFEICDVGMHGK